MCRCRGSLRNVLIAACSPQPAFVRHFRNSCRHSTPRQTRQNPAVAHRDAQKVPGPAGHHVVRLSNKPPESATTSVRHKTNRSSAAGHPVVVKSQAKA
jgi:hypothetical protein